MKTLLISALLFVIALNSNQANAADSTANVLTAEEKASGWKLLFDGKSTQGWRAFGKKTFPEKGWVVEDGSLRHVAKGGGGDIITDEQFTDFEFAFEWNIAEGGNSGIKYLFNESRGAVGHEYQVIDDLKHKDAEVGPKRQSGALYDLIPPSDKKKLKPAGEWNSGRIVVRGKNFEHWINGSKVLEGELESSAMKAMIATSKYKSHAGFATKAPTSILLQDHQDEVRFRNLKIRALKPGA